MKRAIIFDFGGVLMKTRDYGPRHAWDARLGLARGSVEAVAHGSDSWQQAQKGQITVEDYWSAVGHALHLDMSEVAQLAQDFFSGDVLDEVMIDQIISWRAEGHVTALLSNDSPALAGKLVDLGIAGLFDEILISGETGYMKPDARAYRVMLERLRRPAETCIFIDDMPANISGATAVGICAVHYVDGMDLEAALAPLLTMADD